MRKGNKILAGLLAACVCLSLLPMQVFADEGDAVAVQEEALDEEYTEFDEEIVDVQTDEEAMEEHGEADLEDTVNEDQADSAEAVVDEDPGAGRLQGYVPDEFYGPAAFGLRSTEVQHASKFDGYTIEKGIDVSKWNTINDWTKVKQAGIQFAFVRVAYRAYGSGTLATDGKEAANIKNATAAGIPVGVYIFSQAITVKEAEEEADFVLKQIAGSAVTMPVVLDFEYASDANGVTGRLYEAKLSKSAATNICMAFCKRVAAAGYTPMVYANKDMLTNGLNASTISASYPIWLAHYTTATDYAGDYDYWQYSEKGSVSGITGNVDMNFRYIKGNSTNPPQTTYTSYRTTDRVNYRSGPGTTYAVQGTLAAGTTISVEDGYSKAANGYTWYRFKMNSQTYYIASAYVQKIGTTSGWKWVTDANGDKYYMSGTQKAYGAKKIDGEWYYFDTITGKMYIGWRQDGAKTYYYDAEGHLALGVKKINGNWYYFNSNGAMHTGWRQDGAKTYYYDAEGHLALGIKKIESYWYYFSSNGAMYIGWRQDGAKTYYYDNEGHLAIGVKKIGAYWYYFSSNGAMYTGWRQEKGNIYYYDNEGHLAIGVKKIVNYWYYFKSNGTMHTGWRQEGEKRYYYDSEGHLILGVKKIEGYWYYFRSNGIMHTGWRDDGNNRYYYGVDGTLQFGEKNINGKWYAFNKSTGIMIRNGWFEGKYYGKDGIRVDN